MHAGLMAYDSPACHLHAGLTDFPAVKRLVE